MPRNGSGTYQLPSGINPVVTQTLITSNWANTTMSDLASALTASMARDGQSPPTANIPWGGFQIKNLGNATALTDAINLNMAQSSAYLRAMAVTGVNAINATLVGGLQVPISGQLLILTPTQNNSGAATLALNGGASYPIVTPGGAAMKAGSLRTGVPYFLMFYNNAWVIQSAGSGAAFAQGAISGWDRPNTGTYPAITIANTSTVAVPSGTGRIIAPGASNFTDATEVVWGAANVAIAALATAFCTTIGVNAAGAITQIAGIAAPEFARDNIVLGVVSHPRGQVIGIQMAPVIYGDMAYASYDLASLFRDSVVNGVGLVPNVSSPLHFDLTPGQLFLMGGDRNNADSPNFVAFNEIQDLSFYPVSGPGVAFASAQNVPVTMYDPNGSGVITAIPGDPNTAVIHRVYMMAGSFFFLYGQNTYPDVTTAVQSVAADDGLTNYPDKLTKATLLGYIIAQKNTTDLASSTAVLAKAGSVGGGGGGGGGISDAPLDGFLYGRQNASWLRASPLLQGPAGTDRYQFAYTNTLKRWSWGADSTAEVGANTGSTFALIRYNDAGTPSGVPISVDRATGVVNTQARPVFNGQIPWDNGNLPSPVQSGTSVSFGTISASVVNVTGSFNDGFGNLRTAITSASNAAAAAQTTANGKVSKTGDTMTGQLTVQAEVLIGSAGAQQARIVTDASGVYWDSRATAGAGTANGAALWRAASHTWTDASGNVRASLDSSGNYVAGNSVRSPVIRGMGGTFATQQRLFERGWNNNVARWVDVIEADGALALYAYDGSGANPQQLLVYRSTVAGGAASLFCNGIINSTLGWGPTSDPLLKEDEGPIDDVFGRIMALNVCKGRYIKEYQDDGKERLFIMADDQMAEKNPEMFLEGVVKHGDKDYNMYDAGQTIALLTAGLQMAIGEIEELRREIQFLKEPLK